MASEDEHEAVSGEEKEEVPVITLLIYCNKLYKSFLSLQYFDSRSITVLFIPVPVVRYQELTGISAKFLLF